MTVPQQSELELELTLRGNLLIQQQRKIVTLEDELAKALHEINKLRQQIGDYEQEKQKQEMGKKPQSRYWTPDEHQRFLEGVDKFGPKDVKSIAALVGTRNPTQVRTHAQKYYLRMRDKKQDDTDKSHSNSQQSDHHNSQQQAHAQQSSNAGHVAVPVALPQPHTQGHPHQVQGHHNTHAQHQSGDQKANGVMAETAATSTGVIGGDGKGDQDTTNPNHFINSDFANQDGNGANGPVTSGGHGVGDMPGTIFSSGNTAHPESDDMILSWT
eukprot:GFYU01004682.1.p1 GENE.GFYU01004682.1~~GFYU01004682.1.p1  ORF type:complete len:270 (+),score=89.90 GFYU01004682.1:264-1073(+)